MSQGLTGAALDASTREVGGIANEARLPSLPARVLAVIAAPRATFEAVVRSPRWMGVLALTFLVSASSTALLLETDVGQLALVDQWERTASAFGQNVDDSQYAAMERGSRNGLVYAVVSALVTGPLLAVVLAAGCTVVFGARAKGVTYRQALAVVAHAGVILGLRQFIAAPIAYARETLVSPMTLGLFFAVPDEASAPARFFGIVDLFVMWWVVALAIGVSVLYGRPARPLALTFVGAYVALAALLAAAMAVSGGTA